MIDRRTIELIMDTAKIEEVVGDFVALRRRGVNLIGLCPFHNEKTPSFTVSPAKNLCKCFGCGKGGNPVHFIMEHEQLSYPDALRWLAKKYHIEIKERELTDEEKREESIRESLFVINQYALQHFTDTLHNTEEGNAIGLNYFRHRGLRDETIKKFCLGYSLEKRDSFSAKAIKAGYNPELITKTGVCYSTDDGRLIDRFWGRVIFPVHTLSGKVVAFGGRVLQNNPKAAKYVNSPESEIYHKSDHLYGLYFSKQAIVQKDRCILVEGYLDVISMHQAGIQNVVASSGTSLTTGQIKLIHRFTNNITLLYDGDNAGIKASIRGIDMLLEEGMNINVVLLPNGEDRQLCTEPLHRRGRGVHRAQQGRFHKVQDKPAARRSWRRPHKTRRTHRRCGKEHCSGTERHSAQRIHKKMQRNAQGRRTVARKRDSQNSNETCRGATEAEEQRQQRHAD